MNDYPVRSAEPELIFNEAGNNLTGKIDVNINYTLFKEPVKPRDPRAIRLEKYLRSQDSDLSKQSDLIIELSDKYNIDYKIPVSIAGLESGYCRVNFRKNNCWGFGTYSWNSLEIALKEYFRLMYKGYFSKGADTIHEIAPTYAPVSEDYNEKFYYHYNRIP